MQFKYVIILCFLTLLISSCNNTQKEINEVNSFPENPEINETNSSFDNGESPWINNTQNISRFGVYSEVYTEIPWSTIKGDSFMYVDPEGKKINPKEFPQSDLNKRKKEIFTIIDIEEVDMGWKGSYEARAQIDFYNNLIWLRTGENRHERYAGRDSGWYQLGFEPEIGDNIEVDFMYDSKELHIYSVSNSQ
ncbi:hypothetical protein J4471_04465 [Candidatus Woesearchaeota archaeon]|nr:hypothetical protein [Candidatus Woesearchaeota archaeon]